MRNTFNDLASIACITLASTLLLWLPFVLHLPAVLGIAIPEVGFQTIQRNYDGLNYIIVAKSLYQEELIGQFPQELSAEYFAAHFPGYPLMIRLFAPLIGYLNSMVLVTVFFSVMAVVTFYLLLKELRLPTNIFWLSVVFLFLPARWLIVRSVGTPEPMFITFILLSFLFFSRALQSDSLRHYVYSGLFGALAVFTKSPGILLFCAYGLYLLWDARRNRQEVVVEEETSYSSSKDGVRVEKLEVSSSQRRSNNNLGDFLRLFRWNAYPLLLIPLALLGVFYVYWVQYGDFFAYFHSGDNIHLRFPPFQVFNSGQFWVGDFWLEDIVFYFLIYATAFFFLWRQKLYPFAIFVGVFLLASMSVIHRDIARYSLPIAPFAIIAFSDLLNRKEFKYAFVVVIIAIYLYAINFVIGNTFPAVNLGPYQ